MNILFFTDTDVPHLGGKSSHIVDLADGLKAIGHQVHIISGKSISTGMRWQNKFKKLFFGYLRWLDYGTYSWKSMEIVDRTLQKIAKKYLKTHPVDVISAQDPISALYAYELVGEKIPVVLTMHSYFGKSMSILSDKRTGMRQKDFDRIRERDVKCLGVIKELVAVDTRIKEDCQTYMTQGGYTRVGLQAILNFVNIDAYKPASAAEKQAARAKLNIPEGKKVALCVRRLVDKNGVHIAVQALEQVPDAILLVGGDGPNRAALENYVQTHQLSDKVRFLGGIDGELKKTAYQAADMALVPSITVNGLQEATSVSALEAMAYGLGTIVSSIGGLKELVKDRQNGLLVPEQDPVALAQALNTLCTEEGLLKRISEAARKDIVENYSHISAAKKYAAVFQKAQRQ